MKKDCKFGVFSNVKFVKGWEYSLIMDLQREKIYRVDSKYSIVFEKSTILTFDFIAEEFGNEEARLVIDFLKGNDLINQYDCKEKFPDLHLSFSHPSVITNMVVHLSDVTSQYSERIVSEMDAFRVKAVVLFSLVDDIQLQRFLEFSVNSFITSLDIYLLNSSLEKAIELFSSYVNYPFIRNVVFTDHTVENGVVKTDGFRNLINTEGVENYVLSCGKVLPAYFSKNLLSVSEALEYNSCLNRKISIDEVGDIKNCPSMKESYGNIKDTTLAEAIEKPGFKKYWDINKDKIHVCKDCEFRYICTDCRAYVEDPEDILSKPLKCGYNPYTGEWNEWSINPLKQKAIDFYGMREMVSEMSSQSES